MHLIWRGVLLAVLLITLVPFWAISPRWSTVSRTLGRSIVTLPCNGEREWDASISALLATRFLSNLSLLEFAAIDVNDSDHVAAIAVHENSVFLLRPSLPLDKRHPWLRSMLKQLVRASQTEKLFDCYFLLHTWDLPLAPTVSSKDVTRGALVLGPSTPRAGTHNDVPVPNGAFESLITLESGAGVPYDEFLRHAARDAPLPWSNRAPVAFFRGSMTCSASGEECVSGSAVCPRLEAASFSRKRPDLVNAALTNKYDGAFDACIEAALSGAGASGTGISTTTAWRHAQAQPVPIPSHARWRYLLHFGGTSYSYRLQRILPLGSAVLAEAQARAHLEFYTTALEAVGGVIPWSCDSRVNGSNMTRIGDRCSRSMTQLVQAVRDDDVGAARVAAAGAAFAASHLTSLARSCYWARLLRAVAVRRSRVGGGRIDAQEIRAAFPRAQRLELEQF